MRADLQERLARALFSKPLVVNSFRGTLVEAIVALALEPECNGWPTAGARSTFAAPAVSASK